MKRLIVLTLLLAGVAAQMSPPAMALGRYDRTQKWYCGNTHMHSFWSDGNHFPEMAASWYKNNGYQFVVLTDHNNRPTEEGWKDISRYKAEDPAGTLANEFGHDHVKTKQDAKGKTLHRLLSYDAVSKLVNAHGEFLFIPGEELTSKAGRNPVHMSAINTGKTIGVVQKGTVLETAKANAARARAHEKSYTPPNTLRQMDHPDTRPLFLQLNHPNWRWDMTAEVLAATTDADGFELINPGCHNLGDAHSPSTERMWDIATTLRLKEFLTKPIWAVASDDTHNYHDFEKNATKANPGRGFVMVRTTVLSTYHISQALKVGNFYASTGVVLKTVEFDPKTRELTVEVDPADGGKSYTIEFIGTSKTVSMDSTPAPAHRDKSKGKGKSVPRKITRIYSKEIGKVLQTVKGKTAATFKLPADLLYVRCKVTDTSHKGYTWRGETIPRAAWTQPVGWEPALAELKAAAKTKAKAKK